MAEWKSSESVREGGQIAALFLAGAAAGGLAMWLFSPRTGFENRMRLRATLRSGRDRMAQMPRELAKASESTRRKVNRSVGRLQQQLR